MESEYLNYVNIECFILSILMIGGQASGLASRQDCTQFEDALRRLYALELKLTDQVRDFWKLFSFCFEYLISCQGCIETPTCSEN